MMATRRGATNRAVQCRNTLHPDEQEVTGHIIVCAFKKGKSEAGRCREAFEKDSDILH